MLEVKVKPHIEERTLIELPYEFKNLPFVSYDGRKYYNLSYNKEKVLKLKHP